MQGAFHGTSEWLTKSSPKVAEGGAELATVTVKPPTCDPAPEQRLEVQRLVLLRLHTVVSGSHQNRAKQECEVSSAPGLSLATFPTAQPGALPTSHSCLQS